MHGVGRQAFLLSILTVAVLILAMHCDIQYDNTADVRYSLRDVSPRKLRRVALPERTAVSVVIRLTIVT